MTTETPKIDMDFLTLEDYKGIKEAMIESYKDVSDPYWTEKELDRLLKLFPEGQVGIKIDGEIAGCALSVIIESKLLEDQHTYREATGNYTFNTHTRYGDRLYGVDLFIKPEYRGMRLGRRLYDYRKELCEKLNLKGITFGGRIPGYHNYADSISPKEYIERVKRGEIEDPVLNFHLSNDFYPERVLRGYLEGDTVSKEFAVLLKWENIYYEKRTRKAEIKKVVVRLGLVQWQMRNYRDMADLVQQIEFFVDALGSYNSDFALFPEFFNAPLMADYNHLSEPDAIRKLAEYTEPLLEEFSKLAISYNINIITGSMPEMRGGDLYNTGYLCRRDGSSEKYDKIHVTPDESRIWGLKGGDGVRAFDTDCGKIGVLVCYDSEFPELGRLLADEGMDILFVPYLTDTQNAYSRVRHCAQARAIENECYVAISGSVGNLPRVHNMDIQYSQSVVMTPCDFPFPINGVKTEATPNTEMILISDVDLDLLRELHNHGSVRNLKDRRFDLYRTIRTGKKL